MNNEQHVTLVGSAIAGCLAIIVVFCIVGIVAGVMQFLGSGIF